MRYRWDPAYAVSRLTDTPDRSSLRVSDAERNEVADKLSRHFADGRLDEVEFKERLDAAMSAKTQADLAGLFDDLPAAGERAAARPVPAAAAARPVPRHHGLRRVPRRRLPVLRARLARLLPHFGWLIPVAIGVFIWTRLGLGHRHHHHATPTTPSSTAKSDPDPDPDPDPRRYRRADRPGRHTQPQTESLAEHRAVR